jgi:uncharacterized damage-inducible protein DinB
MADSRAPEVWQRGPVPGFDPLLIPVAHALLQVQEDLRSLGSRVASEHLWERPGGAASIAFHIRHIAGSTDRLLTYARNEALTDEQWIALSHEASQQDPRPTRDDLIAEAVASIDRALAQVRATPRESLLAERKVGRAGLPSTTLGLLFHAAEHATRHTGQAITTAMILTGRVVTQSA